MIQIQNDAQMCWKRMLKLYSNFNNTRARTGLEPWFFDSPRHWLTIWATFFKKYSLYFPSHSIVKDLPVRVSNILHRWHSMANETLPLAFCNWHYREIACWPALSNIVTHGFNLLWGVFPCIWVIYRSRYTISKNLNNFQKSGKMWTNWDKVCPKWDKFYLTKNNSYWFSAIL